MKGIFYLIILSLCIYACEKPNYRVDTYIFVYKTRQDYSRNIYIRVNEEKTKVTSYPSLSDIDTIEDKLPKKLVYGYYLGTRRNGENGIQAVVTSATVYSYATVYNLDSLIKLVIDYDPFLEYYVSKDISFNNSLRNNFGVDTSKLNTIIRHNELDRYFEKLK